MTAIAADNWAASLLDARVLGNSLAQWAGLLGVLLASLALSRIVGWAITRQAARCAANSRLEVLGLLLRGVIGPAKLLILAGGLHVAGQFLTLQKVEQGQLALDLKAFWRQVVTTLAVLAAGWFIYRLVDIVEHYLHRWAARSETSLDVQVVPVIRRTLRVLVVIAVGLFIAQNVFDWNVGALLAGLGIGGLAMALAAQSMLADLFGSVRIFADKPFRAGDLVKIKDYQGSVEEAGLRCTRLRLLDGSVVTLPNAVVASGPVENLSLRPSFRRILNVTVTYDTPPARLQLGLEIIRRMLDARKDHFPPDMPPRAYFSDFNADSLGIFIIYWFTPTDWWAFQQFNHDFNMELLTRFNEQGIEFAFPTRTVYVRDAKSGPGAAPSS
ncbi:MAG: mechanosensitive ion channel family protein [Phycisphaerae bacterium]